MFAKQQAVSVLNKARDAYNAQLQKGKDMGLDEEAQAEPVRVQKRTHMTLQGRGRCMQQCQNAMWTQSVFESLSLQALLVGRSNVYSQLSGRACGY